MKILMGISNNRAECNVKFFQSIFAMFITTKAAGHEIVVQFMDYYDVAMMRNYIVTETLENDFDYVFFMDADMIYPHDAIIKLMAHNKDCVQGYYLMRKHPHRPVHYKKFLQGADIYSEDNCIWGTGLQQQKIGGFGGVLIKKAVLQKMKYPWFEYINDRDTRAHWGEDIYFFLKLEENGYESWVDVDLKFGHIANAAIYGEGEKGKRVILS